MDLPLGLEQNALLAALPERVRARLLPRLEPVSLPLGKTLSEPTEPPTHLYFPVNCLLSTAYEQSNGDTVDTPVIGHEGVAGISLFMGGEVEPSRIVVQHEGNAFRLPAKHLESEFRRSGALKRTLLRYVRALLVHTIQVSMCERLHTPEQHVACRLLLIVDRLSSSEKLPTQQSLSRMLGAHRAAFSKAARKLHEDRLIDYHDGRLVVNNRQRIEARCCECYETIREEYDRLVVQT